MRISLAGRRRAHRTLSIRVSLSKISSVALRVARGERTIVARNVTLRRGRHTFTLRPSRRGELAIAVQARDPAGNAASATRSVTISGKT